MAVMRRGSNVALTREIPGLTGIVFGINWDAGSESLLSDNLVVAAILCDAAGKAVSDEHFVFFNQLSSPDLSVTQLEEALGDDEEQIEVNFAAVPADISRIAVVLYINEGTARRRALGQLKQCGIRVLNLADNSELVRSENLAQALSAETGISLGEVYRHNGGWKFKVVGGGYTKGIEGIAADYGVTL
ncbi:TerD family protein [Catellatospora methionotrophica]|uniref:TerD family protein n=1 Tax=Catellatospora methionotrophica TaxID=121620 RepID=UPI0033FC6AF4